MFKSAWFQAFICVPSITSASWDSGNDTSASARRAALGRASPQRRDAKRQMRGEQARGNVSFRGSDRRGARTGEARQRMKMARKGVATAR